MIKAVTTLTEFAFKNLRYNEIYGIVHTENIASQSVLIKSGFENSGEVTGKYSKEKCFVFTLKKP